MDDPRTGTPQRSRQPSHRITDILQILNSAVSHDAVLKLPRPTVGKAMKMIADALFWGGKAIVLRR